MSPASPVRPLRLAVLISGRGSNLLAIARACAEGRLAAQVVLVVADVADAAGLDAARALGIPAQALPWATQTPDRHAARNAFETQLRRLLDAVEPDLVILAGFMRVLSADFVGHYTGRMLNIHPSLLPAYKGLHTHQRALAAGEREHGATVHLVTGALDGGPALLQARVPVLPGDTAESLSARVHRQEHIIYPQVIQWIAEGRLQCVDGMPMFDGVQLREPRQLA
jgi:phosphoribosylglycinamide formyltransferase-1